MASVLAAFSSIDRLRVIAQTLARHGFGEVASRMGLGGGRHGGGDGKDAAGGAAKDAEGSPARISTSVRLRLVLQDLGPTFVKLGQVLSTRADLLPADVIAELKKLQDDVPPVPVAEIRKEIEETLGAPVETIFDAFDERPLASASIGQVHRARLRAGDAEPAHQVVVKVQRPRVRETVERDLDLLYLFARLLERAVPESTVYSPVGLVGEFDRAIRAELDFTLEADNARKFAESFAGHPHCSFPRVYAQASGRKVLTLELIDGKKLPDAIAAGFSGELLARRAVGIIIKMIFEDGFFHADPHPGNLFVLGAPDDPTLCMIDLGLVGRLTPGMRDKAMDMVLAAARKDTRALADALLALGRPRGQVDRAAFHAEVERLSDVHLGRPLKEIQLAAMVRDLVEGAVKFDIEMPIEIMLVGKALMTVEGIGKELYPDLDVFEEARPHLVRLVLQRYSPQRIGQDLLRGLGRLSTAAVDLPGQVHEILEDLRRGALVLRAPDPALPPAMDRLGRRLFAGLAATGFIGAGAALEIARRHGLGLLGIVLLLLGAVVFFGHLVADWRRRG